MFCEKCGTQLEDDSNFCTNCGTPCTNEINTNEKLLDTELLLRIKPTFKFAYLYLPIIIEITIPILIVSGMFMILNFILGIVVALVGFLIFGIIMGIESTLRRKQYDSKTFDFYRTKVIYKDTFWGESEKEVKYKNIREITMHQRFIQKHFNLGNIIIHTNSGSYQNGIYILDVENVNDIYMQINSIINI